MTYLTHLECTGDGERFSADQPRNNTCPAGDLLVARYDLERLARTVRRDDIARGPSSLWRYAPMLPVAKPAGAVTFGEGWTPLLPLTALGRELGCSELYLKDEGRNPSGTFKDRGTSVAITRMRELGITTVAHNSSGNAGGSWALYAARAGILCVNLLPEDALPASVQQSALAGAETFVLEGPWGEAGAMVAKSAERHGWFNICTLKEPYRLEGKKTMGYELVEQMGWEFPDVVIYPTGGALGAIAIFKAFDELKALGWVDPSRAARLIVTQYEGCAPIVKAHHGGKERSEPWTKINVLPGGLKSPSPPGDKETLRILRETGGTAIAVSSEDAIEEVKRMTCTEGILPAPEAATTLAGLRIALESGEVRPNERIVLLNTGSGLKSIPVLPEPAVIQVQPGADLVRS